MDGPGFITVKHGENQQDLFNTWCPCLILLKTIHKKIVGEDRSKETKKPNMKLDLIDVNGELKNLTDHMTEYAYNFVDPRETYVLVHIEANEETSTYTPMMTNVGKWFPKIKDKLDILSRKQHTTSKGSRWAAIKTVTKFSALSKKASKDKKDSRRSSQTGSERTESASSEMTSSRKSSSRTGRKVKDK